MFNLEKITPGRKNLHRHRLWCLWQIWGMHNCDTLCCIAPPQSTVSKQIRKKTHFNKQLFPQRHFCYWLKIFTNHFFLGDVMVSLRSSWTVGWYLVRYLNVVDIWCLWPVLSSDRVQMFDLASLQFSQSWCGYCVIIRKREETVQFNKFFKSKKVEKVRKSVKRRPLSSSRPGGKREMRVNLKNCLPTNLSNGLSSSVSFSTQTQTTYFGFPNIGLKRMLVSQ